MTLTFDRERFVVVSPMPMSWSERRIIVGSVSVFVSGGGGGGVSTARDVDLGIQLGPHSELVS